MPKTKDKKAKAVNYSLISSDEPPYEIVQRLVEKHHQHLIDAKIAIAWRYGIKDDKDGRLVLGQARKATDLSRELVDYDFIILLNYQVYTSREFSDAQREALLDHELCHCQIALDKDEEPIEDDKGRRVYRMRKHDIEEFREIVQRHGLYKNDLEEFGRVILEGKGKPLFKIAEA